MFYVYILQSEKYPDRFYTGQTQDLDLRLERHNTANKPYRRWPIKNYVAFTDADQALAFETYLKTHSGRAFARKRL